MFERLKRICGMDRDLTSETFTEYLEAGRRHIWVGSNRYGYVTLDENRCEIRTLRVQPEQRGSGVGSYLLRQAEDALKDCGYKEAFLLPCQTERDVDTKQLRVYYGKRGYVPVEHWLNPFKSGYVRKTFE